MFEEREGEKEGAEAHLLEHPRIDPRDAPHVLHHGLEASDAPLCLDARRRVEHGGGHAQGLVGRFEGRGEVQLREEAVFRFVSRGRRGELGGVSELRVRVRRVVPPRADTPPHRKPKRAKSEPTHPAARHSSALALASTLSSTHPLLRSSHSSSTSATCLGTSAAKMAGARRCASGAARVGGRVARARAAGGMGGREEAGVGGER